MRTTQKISITLEGNSWDEILQGMTIIQNAAGCPRIEAKAERANIANPCRKCQDNLYNKLMTILEDGYGLGPEEVAEILWRVR